MSCRATKSLISDFDDKVTKVSLSNQIFLRKNRAQAKKFALKKLLCHHFLLFGGFFREARDKNNKSATPTSAALSLSVTEMIT